MEEESRRKEQEAAQILEDEIRQHLDELDEQVQRAKKQASSSPRYGMPTTPTQFDDVLADDVDLIVNGSAP